MAPPLDLKDLKECRKHLRAGYLSFKTATQLKSKDVKKVTQTLASALNVQGTDDVVQDAILALAGNPKPPITQRKIDGAGGVRLTCICVANERAVAVEIGAGAKASDGGLLIPTCALLWRILDAANTQSTTQPWTTVFCPPFVAEKVLGGANLMAPGVLAVLRGGTDDGSDAAAPLEPGTPVALSVPGTKLSFYKRSLLCDFISALTPPPHHHHHHHTLLSYTTSGNPVPFATGVLGRAVSELPWIRGKHEGFDEGIAVHVITCFGDGLWELAGRPVPNVGFRAPASGSTMSVTSIGIAVAGLEAQEDDDESDGDEDGDDDDDDDDDDNEKDNNDAGRSVNTAQTSSGNETEETQGIDGDGSGGEEEDWMLLCFLQAIKTRLAPKGVAKAKKVFPLAMNDVYANHMRPCRPCGVNLDAKKSRYGSLRKFFEAAACDDTFEEGGALVSLTRPKPPSNEPMISSVTADHPLLAEFRPWPQHATHEAAERDEESAARRAAGECTAFELAPLTIRRVLRATTMAQVEVLGGSLGASPASVYVEEADKGNANLKACIAAHVVRQQGGGDAALPRGNDPVTLDPTLVDALFPPNQRSKLWSADVPLPTSLPFHDVASRLERALDAVWRVAGGTLRKEYTYATLPPVELRTYKEKGHALTSVGGLDKYGVDVEAAAVGLKSAMGCAARVERTPKAAGGETTLLVVQGAREGTLADYLVDAMRLHRSCLCVVQAKGVKERSKDKLKL